jgi:purine-binding chemotaxis protein CheW
MNNEANSNAQDESDAASAPTQAASKLQVVRTGRSQFGVFADQIATIVAWRPPTPLPNAPKAVLGVVSVQGRMLTVIDLASLPGGETPSDSLDSPSSLVALRGDEQLALAVDEVGESIELDSVAFNAQPQHAGKLFLGVLQRNGAPIKILNLKELFPTAIQGRERRRRRF